MMPYKSLSVLFFLLLTSLNLLQSQNSITDSLKQALSSAKHDTTICNVYFKWGENLYLSNMDSAALLWEKSKVIAEKNIIRDAGNKKLAAFYSRILPYIYNNIGSSHSNRNEYESAKQFYNKALALYLKNNDKAGAAEAYNNIGYIHECLNQLNLASENYQKSLKLREETKDMKGMATTLNNIGYLLEMQGDPIKGLDYFSKSLKIREEIKDIEGIGHSLSNIGSIYQNQGDTKKAMEYHLRALKCREEVKDREGIAVSLMNIAYLYGDQENYDKALEYFQKSMDISKETGNIYYEAHILNLMGNVYRNKGEGDQSLEYYKQALKLYEELKNPKGLSTSYSNIGLYYEKANDYNKATLYFEKSLKLGKESGYPSFVLKAADHLYSIYKKQNKSKQALEMHELYTQLKDSITNEDTKKAALKNQFQNEYDKKEVEIKAISRTEKEKIELKAAEEKKRQNLIIYSITIGLFLVSLFSIFIFRGLQKNKKANKIITLQKQEVEAKNHIIEEKSLQVEEKQKEIIDSINYAQRIQRSLLASTTLLKENLNNHFVLFKPKDIVSGDFYWAAELPNGSFALLTADSTGHGVPGAIMSMLNIACLNEAISKGHTAPAEILFETRKRIIEHLKNDGSAEGGKDGMDCSLICFDHANKKFSFAVANNPVWVVRENTLIELSPDKMPVGKHDKDHVPFTQSEFQVQKGDMVYALTDGYPDQFGGPKGKKFMYKQLKESLVKISNEPLNRQSEILDHQFEKWRSNLEQVDDVCIIGVRL